MIRGLTLALLLAASPARADDAPAPRRGLLSGLRYAVGLAAQVGVSADGSVFGDGVVFEPLAFELRSFLTPRVAFHTTLNLARMIVPAAQGDGRIDYDCHLALHLPLPEGRSLVVAPGAAIAYSLTGSGFQRIVGDLRVGLDRRRGAWTTGIYLRPQAGWYREAGDRVGRPTGGLALDLVAIVHLPRRSER